MGCETSRGRVPSERSLLMASKPKAMPSTGPSSATMPANDGNCWPLMPAMEGEMVNSSGNTGICPVGVRGIWLAASRRLPETA